MSNSRQEQMRKPLKDLTLLDRFLFDTAMSDPQICRNILSIIFSDREIPQIRYGAAEQSLEPFSDSRAVRLDLLAYDEEGNVYDAEAQKENKGKRFLLRRSRLYQSAIDVNLLKPGDFDFGKLNDVYVIFIAPFDLFGENKYMYTFRMSCDEAPGLSLNDGAVRIFLNTRGRNDDEVPRGLVEFLHYAEAPERYGREIKDMRVQELASRIEMLKGSQEVGVKYMRLWEEMEEARMEARTEGREEGREEGRKEGREEGRETGMAEERLASIKNLMRNTGWPVEKAMDMLDIPKDEREKYVKLMEK